MSLNTTCPDTHRSSRLALLARLLPVACVLCLSIPMSTARGDDIYANGQTFTRARILGLHSGELEIRLEDGQTIAVPLVDVEFLQVDRGASFADFNQAERMRAEGRADQSLARYRRAMRITEGFWSEIVPVRFCQAADLTGDLEIATNLLIQVTHGRSTGPGTAIRILPDNIPDRRNGRVAASLDVLNVALTRDVDHAQATVLTVMRHKILMRLESKMTLNDLRRVTNLSVPESVRTQYVFETVRRSFDSLMAQMPLTPKDYDDLDRAIDACPDAFLPEFLLIKGAAMRQAAQSGEDWIRTSWPFLRVPIHFPDSPLVADGYLGAADALGRAGRMEDARLLLSKCLEAAPKGGAVAKAAEALLTKVNQPVPQ